jgi:hypothetical protein
MSLNHCYITFKHAEGLLENKVRIISVEYNPKRANLAVIRQPGPLSEFLQFLSLPYPHNIYGVTSFLNFTLTLAKSNQGYELF